MEIKPDKGKNKEYEVEVIKNSVIHANKVARGQLSELYYLVS